MASFGVCNDETYNTFVQSNQIIEKAHNSFGESSYELFEAKIKKNKSLMKILS